MPYRVIKTTDAGNVSETARTAKEAGEFAAKAVHAGEEVVIKDDRGQIISEADLAERIRKEAGEVG